LESLLFDGAVIATNTPRQPKWRSTMAATNQRTNHEVEAFTSSQAHIKKAVPGIKKNSDMKMNPTLSTKLSSWPNSNHRELNLLILAF
jgi:hypothetical protein